MTHAQCPTCGGSIDFKAGSSCLVVCPHCNSAIARTDRELKDLGKVAALIDTESQLRVGLSGAYFNHPFTITGRAQMKHVAGGIWDEWYAAFSDGRWGWLAEAQGRFTMTFVSPLPQPPAYAQLEVGAAAPNVPAGLVVVEKGSATYASAEGEIPYFLTPGETSTYADLNGPHGLFATLDYSDEKPVFYAGKHVLLEELKLDGGAAAPMREKTVAVTNLACPKCGGALALRAPDQTERVGCPYCGSLLDCSSGKLSILQALSAKFEKPLIPLGSVAEFEGKPQTVIGFLLRSCVIEGTKYFWREYLLYNPALGFRWLVVSDGHWSYVKNVNLAHVLPSGKDMSYDGQTFRRFQDSEAKVELVLGEFYWKVEIGETVSASDFIAPPRMLSIERMNYRDGRGAEVSCSLGEYVPVEDIRAKFKLAALASPTGVGACQPNPHQGFLIPWIIMVAASIALAIFMAIVKPSHDIFIADEMLEAVPAAQPSAIITPTTTPETTPSTTTDSNAAATTPETGQVLLTPQFDLNSRYLTKIKVESTVDNSWLSVQGDLINEETGEVSPFDFNVEYYHGYDDGESWSEGSQSNYTYVSAVPAGKYTLRLECFWENMKQPLAFKLKVTQDASRAMHFIALLFAISVIPVWSLVMHFLYERTRWGSED